MQKKKKKYIYIYNIYLKFTSYIICKWFEIYTVMLNNNQETKRRIIHKYQTGYDKVIDTCKLQLMISSN